MTPRILPLEEFMRTNHKRGDECSWQGTTIGLDPTEMGFFCCISSSFCWFNWSFVIVTHISILAFLIITRRHIISSDEKHPTLRHSSPTQTFHLTSPTHYEHCPSSAHIAQQPFPPLTSSPRHSSTLPFDTTYPGLRLA